MIDEIRSAEVAGQLTEIAGMDITVHPMGDTPPGSVRGGPGAVTQADDKVSTATQMFRQVPTDESARARNPGLGHASEPPADEGRLRGPNHELRRRGQERCHPAPARRALGRRWSRCNARLRGQPIRSLKVGNR